MFPSNVRDRLCNAEKVIFACVLVAIPSHQKLPNTSTTWLSVTVHYHSFSIIQFHPRPPLETVPYSKTGIYV